MRVLVVGASGLVGGEAALKLNERGYEVRALVRGGGAHPRATRFARSGIEIIDGDLTNPRSLSAACRGIEALVCTATSMPQGRDNGLVRVDLEGVSSLIGAAEHAGIRRFVYISYSGNIRYDSPLETAKRTCEALLLNSAMSAVVLRPSYFMETWLSPALGFDPLNSTTSIYGSGNHKVSYVSAHDVASFAVAALDKEIAIDQVIEIGGPEAISQLEAAGAFESKLNRKFRFHFVSREALESQHGTSDPLQKTFAALMLSYVDGDEVADAQKNADTFGIRLQSVAEYATRFARESASAETKEDAHARTA